VLFCVWLFVNVYCFTSTGCQPNCSLKIYHIISYHSIIGMFRQIIWTSDKMKNWKGMSHPEIETLLRGNNIITYHRLYRQHRNAGNTCIHNLIIKCECTNFNISMCHNITLLYIFICIFLQILMKLYHDEEFQGCTSEIIRIIS
jgi:hypothetical protein